MSMKKDVKTIRMEGKMEKTDNDYSSGPCSLPPISVGIDVAGCVDNSAIGLHMQAEGSDASDSFNKKDLFEGFSYYAFTGVGNQPYNEKELLEEFEKWFKHKYSKK